MKTPSDPRCPIPVGRAKAPAQPSYELPAPRPERDLTTRVLMAVAAERGRQELLCASGKFAYTAASEGVSIYTRFPILLEEVGEVAKELNENPYNDGTDEETLAWFQRLRTELIQVAAVATALCESVEKQIEVRS